MNIWIDITNPPQVQYLSPLQQAFQQRGHRVMVTARDLGATLELLEGRGANAVTVGGGSFGVSLRRKTIGTLRLSRNLTSVLKPFSPDALVCAGRASVLAARRLGIPSFGLVDYEYTHLALLSFTRTTVLFPDVIPQAALRRRGLSRRQLVPFKGLKEDISFADIDVEAVPAHRFSTIPADLVRILVRPPADDSHYYDPRSTKLLMAVLRHLSSRHDVVVVYSPRHPGQLDHLARFEWVHPPVVLSKPVPFVSLLKSVDGVFSSGGTMVREAAYIGVPAYSTFGSRIGAVDRHLAAIGRVRFLRRESDVEMVEMRKADRAPLMGTNPHLGAEIVGVVERRVHAVRAERRSYGGG